MTTRQSEPTPFHSRKPGDYERLESELKKRKELNKSLLALFSELQSSTNSDQVIQAIYRTVSRDLNYPSCWIYYKKPGDTTQVHLWAIRGTAEQLVGSLFLTIPLKGDAYLDEIFKMNGPVYVEDAQNDPRVNAEIVARLKNRTIINVAFSLTDVPEGVLAMGTYGDEGTRSMSELESEYIETMAGLVAVTIDRLMVQEHRNKAEEIVRENEERYRILSSLTSDMVYKLRVEPDESLVVEWISGALEKITGYTVDEVRFVELSRIVHADDLPLVQKGIATLLNGSASSIEYRIKNKSGEIRWLSDHNQPIYDPVEKRVTHILGGMLDITERKLNESRLRAQKEFLHVVIESLTHPFYVINTSDFTVTMANAAARTKDKKLIRTCYELTHNSDRPCCENGESCPMEQIKKTKTATIVEHIHYTSKQEPRIVEVHGYPILDQNGEVTQMIEYVLDITDRKHSEKLLKQREFELNESQRLSEIGSWDWNAETDTIFWSDTYYRVFGFDPTKPTPNYLEHLKVYTAESAAILDAGVKKAMESGEAYEFELELAKPTTKTRWISAHGEPVWNEKGEICGLRGTAQNITPRKLAERELSLLTFAINHVVEEVYLMDDSGHFQYANEGAATALGYNREELLKMNVLDVDPTFSPEKWQEHWQYLKEQGALTFETLHQSATGHTYPVEVNANAIEYDNRTYNLVLSRDISERKKSDEALLKLSHAVEQSPVTVFITDIKGRIEYVNPEFTRVTGYTAKEALGNTPNILKSGEMPASTYAELWETISVGQTWRGEFRNRKKNGDLYWEKTTISPIIDENGKTTHFVAIKEDITERRSLEEQFRQSQKMEAIGQLAGGVAHDFNNMLSVIMGHTELALMDLDVNPTINSHLQEILGASERSAKLTRQLLAFARKQTAVPQFLDLNETLTGMVGMLKHLIGESIELNWVPGKGAYLVNMDPSQIDQILANLSVNARDAISGIGKLTIGTSAATFDNAYAETHPGYLAGNFVCLSVSDNGCGMSHLVLNKLFEPFFTTKEKGKGTGLGLATVYGIVKQNNGFIQVVSEPGVGSTFKIYLPQHKGKLDPLGTPNALFGQKAHGHETILVVEDEVSVLNITQMTLTKYGYNLVVASSPGEAIRRALDFPGTLDLLITDLIMPEMNGKELYEQLTTHFPGLKCLYMSGYSGEVFSNQGILEKGINFIQKPFARDALVEKVRHILDMD